MSIKQNGKRVVFDCDGVICRDDLDQPYHEREPYPWVKGILQELKNEGWTIILQTARYFYRCNGDINKINEAGLQELKDWLVKWEIPHDEVYMGKAAANAYVDDKGIRIDSNEGKIGWNLLPQILKGYNKK